MGKGYMAGYYSTSTVAIIVRMFFVFEMETQFEVYGRQDTFVHMQSPTNQQQKQSTNIDGFLGAHAHTGCE